MVASGACSKKRRRFRSAIVSLYVKVFTVIVVGATANATSDELRRAHIVGVGEGAESAEVPGSESGGGGGDFLWSHRSEAVSKAANAGVSVMLLGSVSFMMGLFYLVNHPDRDMVKYCWQVISSTISIFSAVLIFQAVNGLIEKLFLEDASEAFELFVGMAHFMVWFIGLQVMIAWLSGALTSGEVEHTKESEEKMEGRIKCYAILMGHITGFAGINAFGVIQQQAPRDFTTALCVAPVAWIVVYILSQVMAHLRDAIAKGDDNKIDRGEELWDEVTGETEDDIIGLAVSFLIVQALRLGVTGKLPNDEGEEAESDLSSHPDWQVLALFFIGVLLVLIEFARLIYVKHSSPRLTPQLRNIIMMCFAWCFYNSTNWALCFNYFVSEHGMIKEVTLALLITAISFSAIFFLDKLADMPATGDQIDHAIRSVVRALGILIGFSWEKAFDTAVASISSVTASVVEPQVTKLAMAIALVTLVVPAWRHFILPTIIAYEKEDEEGEEEEAAEDAVTEGEAGQSKAGLSEPLISRKNSEKAAAMAPRGRHPSVKGKSAKEGKGPAHERKCQDYEHHILALERRNAKLEASLADFVGELGQLQRMADDLRRGPTCP